MYHTPDPGLQVIAKSGDYELCLTSIHYLQANRDEWDAAVTECGGCLYLTVDWMATWWTHYGRECELRVYVFVQSGKIIGGLPLYIDALGLGPARLRIARVVGANVPPKVFDMPLPADKTEAMLSMVVKDLFRGQRCHLLSLGPVSSHWPGATALGAVCRAQEAEGRACELECIDVHTVWHLPSSIEEYFASLSKNENKNRRKYELRLLRKEYAVREDTIGDPENILEEFDCFTRQHASQWAAQGKSGHFGAWPGAVEFNRDLVQALAKRRRVRLHRILANDRVISRQYSFAHGKSYIWELPAREIGEPWERFSIGPTGIVRMINAAIQEGMTRLDGGIGHYDYKLRLGAKEYPVVRLRVRAPGMLNRLRVAFWKGIQAAVRIGYHKIWYRRILPLLPAKFRRPQPWVWLRLDF